MRGGRRRVEREGESRREKGTKGKKNNDIFPGDNDKKHGKNKDKKKRIENKEEGESEQKEKRRARRRRSDRGGGAICLSYLPK